MNNPTQGFKVVETQTTPNPSALKFVLNIPVIRSGAKSFNSEQEAEGDPFAEALFSFGDVENIYLHENFVSVTLDCPESWELMGDAVKKTIEEHLTFYDTPDAEETGEKVSILEELKKIDYSQLSDPEKVAVVDALLEETVRPSLAQDGGGLEVIEARDNIVRIRYQGACGSCPSSVTGTLRAIENILSKSLEMEIRVFPN